MASRKDSDEFYVIDLCDEVLGQKASRQHSFDFLRGDGTPGRKLPVDAYYPSLKLVVEYRERQHTESVAFFNKKTTVSGVSRDEQRRIYDQRRKEVLPKHGIRLIEISYSDLKHDSCKRLIRDRQSDKEIIQKLLSATGHNDKKEKKAKIVTSNRVKANVACQSTTKDETQNWAYRLYRRFGCLFVFSVVMATMLLFSYLTISVFQLNEALALFIVILSMFMVGGVFHHYTTGVDGRMTEKRNRSYKPTISSAEDEPVLDNGDLLCWKCGSNMIYRYKDGTRMCLSCGFIFGE